MISWLERIEAVSLYAKRDPRQEALGHSGGKVLDSILSVPSSQPWKILKETLMRDYSEFKSPAHSCTYLENMTQGEDESLRSYVYRDTRAQSGNRVSSQGKYGSFSMDSFPCQY